MTALLITLNILAGLFLIGVVLLQSGKGADMGAAFGGSGSAVFGPSGPGNTLTRITAATAAIFMGSSLLLAVISAGERSVFDGMQEPAPLTAPPTPPPAAAVPTPAPDAAAAAPAAGGGAAADAAAKAAAASGQAAPAPSMEDAFKQAAQQGVKDAAGSAAAAAAAPAGEAAAPTGGDAAPAAGGQEPAAAPVDGGSDQD